VLEELKKNFNGVVLDFGTARSFSAIALAKAIKESEPHLPVVTMDILPRDEKIFWDSPIDLSGKVSF
jgi:predicted O-methyltransferase YrrM